MANEGLFTILITIIGVVIALIIPIPIKEEYRLVIISATILLIISIALSNFNRRLDEQEEIQRRLDEKLKIHEQLINIRADIKQLQKEVKIK